MEFELLFTIIICLFIYYSLSNRIIEVEKFMNNKHKTNYEF